MTECHLCVLEYNDPNNAQNNFLAKCCMKRCNKKYCLKCIRQKFDAEFQSQKYRSDTWICYSCQSICACIICKGISSDKKTGKKRNNQGSNLKQDVKIQNVKEEVYQDYYSAQKIESAQPFMKRILQRRNHIYKLMANAQTPQNNKSVRQTCDQKSQEVLKQEQKIIPRNIKQLIKKTLKQYNEDQNDIQLID